MIKYRAQILGAIVILLAICSVFYTAAYNESQTRYVMCGGQAVEDTILALKSRDAASLAVTVSNKQAVIDRYNLILILSDAPNAPKNLTKMQALANYEASVADYETALDVYANALRQAQLPNAHCLVR
jgi:hypothetical protein